MSKKNQALSPSACAFTAAVEQVQANSFGVSSLLNGAAGDAQVIQPQTGAIQSNLVPLGWSIYYFHYEKKVNKNTHTTLSLLA